MYPVVICDTSDERPLNFFRGEASIFPVGLWSRGGRSPGPFLPNGTPEKTLPIDSANADHLDDRWLPREVVVEFLLRKDEVSLVGTEDINEKTRERLSLVPENHEDNDMRGNCRPELRSPYGYVDKQGVTALTSDTP
jgi:hypothetical protein